MKKIKRNHLLLSGVILLALAYTIGIAIAQDNNQTDDISKDLFDDIKPYDGSIGPGSALYGLKIGIENLRESFTFNDRQKLEIQLEHAKDRIAEAKAELRNRNDDSANRAMDHFVEKIQALDDRITGIDRNDTGLLEAQKEIIKNQFVLARLLDDNPNNTGLMRAYNNSLRLEERFELKTRVKFEREIEDRQRVRIREIGIDRREIETEIRGNATEVKVKVKFLSDSNDSDAIRRQVLDKIKLGRNDINNLIKVETEAGATATPTITGTARATGTATPTVTGTPIPARTPVVTGTPEATEDRLKIQVEAGRGVSEVEAEFKFNLNTADMNAIAEGIFQKLSALTIDDMSRVEIEVRERREDRREDRQEDRRAGESGDDRGGRAVEPGDDRGGRAVETGDDRSGRGSSGGSGKD